MNRTTWRTALFSGLVCCASSAGLWAQSPADVETGDSPDTLIAQGKGKDGGGGGGGAERVRVLPGVLAWITDALAEKDFLDFEEPYRLKP